jgi:predicted signal transduction protein with EAL and GGDEF domain
VSRRTTDDETVLEPRYWPVLDLASGRVVGAALVGTSSGGTGLASERTMGAAWAGSLPVLTRLAAHAFSFGPAAAERWWVSVLLRPGQVAAVAAVDVVAGLLRDSGLPPERLRIDVTELEVAHAVSSGSAADLAELGVGLSVRDFGGGELSSAALRAAPVCSLQVSLAGLAPHDEGDRSLLRSVVALAGSLGIEVQGCDVEADGQLELASAAGITTVQGYRWGSAGSLSKLIDTWVRLPVSE